MSERSGDEDQSYVYIAASLPLLLAAKEDTEHKEQRVSKSKKSLRKIANY